MLDFARKFLSCLHALYNYVGDRVHGHLSGGSLVRRFKGYPTNPNPNPNLTLTLTLTLALTFSLTLGWVGLRV